MNRIWSLIANARRRRRSVVLTVILFERSPGEWVAQCLEHDIGAQARNFHDLFYELDKSFWGHVAICLKHNQQPFECLPRAPQYYWKKCRQEQYAKVSRPPRTPFRIPRLGSHVDTAYHLVTA